MLAAPARSPRVRSRARARAREGALSPPRRWVRRPDGRFASLRRGETLEARRERESPLAPARLDDLLRPVFSALRSLGALLFETLAGALSFPYDDRKELIQAHLSETAPRLHAVRPDLAFPEALEAVLARSLAKRREERFPDAAALAAALDEAVAEAARPAAAGGTFSRDVGFGSTAVVPSSLAPTAVIPGRARLDFPPGATLAGLATVYVIAAPRLRFGRSRPEQDPAAAGNTLVLRILRCRSPALDIAMKGRARGLSRVRVGKDYRLIYEVDSRARLVLVLEIAHRSKIYRNY